jgi:hypothetical protein
LSQVILVCATPDPHVRDLKKHLENVEDGQVDYEALEKCAAGRKAEC